jgi:hypothetical protein
VRVVADAAGDDAAGDMAASAPESPTVSRDPVVAWVGGQAVFFSEVDAERRAWGRSVLGARLGLGGEPGVPRAAGIVADGARPPVRADPAVSFPVARSPVAVGPNGRSGPSVSVATGGAGLTGVGVCGAGGCRAGSLRPDPLDLFVAKVLVTRRCLAHAAARLGIAPDAPRAQWLEALAARGEVGSLEPTDADVERVREARRMASAAERVRARYVRHLLRPTEEAARAARQLIEVLARLAEGAGPSRPSRRPGDEVGRCADSRSGGRVTADLLDAFDVCARALSSDRGSRPLGGVLGWVRRGELVGPLEDAIYSAEPGELIGPIASHFGWHVLVVERERPVGQPVLDPEVLRGEARSERARQEWGLWWEREVARQVVMAPGFEHPRQAGLPGSTHRH